MRVTPSKTKGSAERNDPELTVLVVFVIYYLHSQARGGEAVISCRSQQDGANFNKSKTTLCDCVYVFFSPCSAGIDHGRITVEEGVSWGQQPVYSYPKIEASPQDGGVLDNWSYF